MNRNSSRGLFYDSDKHTNNLLAGTATVNKEQVDVLKTSICEPSGVVQLLVQSDDGCDVMLSEIREVRFRTMMRIP